MPYDNDSPKPSKAKLKRRADDLQALGEQLIALPAPILARLPVPARLRDAVELARELHQRGATRRQRQYIGRLMRELDTDELEQALAALASERASDAARLHEAERWRDRLVEEGTPALEAFFDAFPEADRQRFRHLATMAIEESKRDAPPRRRRELFREIRQLVENRV